MERGLTTALGFVLLNFTGGSFRGKKNTVWVEDAKKRYDEAKNEGRLSNHEGFWSWYSWPPNSGGNHMILTNSNTNQMVTVACMLYDATHEKRFYDDAMLVWEGDRKYPGIEKTFYRGDGKWEGKGGMAAFGKQLPVGGGVIPLGRRCNVQDDRKHEVQNDCRRIGETHHGPGERLGGLNGLLSTADGWKRSVRPFYFGRLQHRP